MTYARGLAPKVPASAPSAHTHFVGSHSGKRSLKTWSKSFFTANRNAAQGSDCGSKSAAEVSAARIGRAKDNLVSAYSVR